jgi:two-component system, OmpR family, response regulator MprA
MTRQRILVADDDAVIREAVTEILEIEGYRVLTAADGLEALRLLRQDPPALLILDMRMPGLNGWEVAAEMRSLAIDVPILVMTAARDARAWAAEVAASAYLAKPFELQALVDAVERLSGPRRGGPPDAAAATNSPRH